MSKPFDLQALLRSAVDLSIVALATELLRACRANRDELYDALLVDRKGSAAHAEIRSEALAIFRELDSDWVDAECVTKLVKLAGLWAGGVHPALVALGYAEALDEALGRRFAGCFRNSGDRVLQVDDAFPVVGTDLRASFPDGLGPRPEKVERPLDASRRLRLLPANLPVRVRLCWSEADALCPITAESKLGFAFANLCISPDHQASEIVWTRYSEDGKRLFFDCRPKDLAAQVEAVRRLVRKAAGEKVDVLLFPELSFTPQVRDALAQELEQLGQAGPAIVLAGSAHELVSGRKVNRAVALLQGGGRLEHLKFTPFEFPDWDDAGLAGQMCERSEDIAHEPLINLYASEHWSLCILICKDFMRPDMAPALVQLRPRLVLVPAFSWKTENFRANADFVATHGQSIVAVANVCDAEYAEATVALLATPAAEAPPVLAPRRELTEEALICIGLNRRTYLHDACADP